MRLGTSGVNVTYMKILAFVISSILAGFAGALYANLVGFLSPDTFTFEVTAQVLSMVLIGGMGTTFGPVFGAIFITALPEMLRMSREYYQVIYGVGVAAAVLFLPQGILGLFHRRKAMKVPQANAAAPRSQRARHPARAALRPGTSARWRFRAASWQGRAELPPASAPSGDRPSRRVCGCLKATSDQGRR